MPYDPSNTQSGRPEDARVEAAWSDLQRDLDTLGRQLNELRNHSAVLGDHLVNSVQASFDQVKGRTLQWQDLSLKQLDELRSSARLQQGEVPLVFRMRRVRVRFVRRIERHLVVGREEELGKPLEMLERHGGCASPKFVQPVDVRPQDRSLLPRAERLIEVGVQACHGDPAHHVSCAAFEPAAQVR